MTTKEVASLTGISRNTASKYLSVLSAKGNVASRQVGKAKMYTVPLELPIVNQEKLEKRQIEKFEPVKMISILKFLLKEKFGDEILKELNVISVGNTIKMKPTKVLGKKFSELKELIEQLGGHLNPQDNSFEI